MNRLILGLGTNLGDKNSNLQEAINLIESEIGTIKKKSSVYETQAWGVENQDNYYNMAIEIETNFWPFKVLNMILAIEEKMGRIRSKKWESRIIDIDILFFNEVSISSENLSIPHPYIQKRRFVLEPVCEISPDYFHPKFRKSVTKLLEDCHDESWIERIAK
ncbi:MAG: 2-amino-4-hydroxy-6-hydroxymethyldihydropteridine diphosphokinase [Cytophagaceae bacterium]|nr:2-amino-4-hydroxy-6-hydroxymethyldihydropteridine diphosphokinase [Cytophagaceae bacterium]MBK9936254.1 2-amino-4-hydroxy-6-hydroxymethyldihydropteridine diphosphokinase [Cytophagaceae bacterium]MBL0303853.1 2-amino-4-hydroxy-6-hydroxymethyldihydropteridine diphosphokinase [Cytophagaceae bacterium]MBL0326670.1 2-amino-4-hydroxy-6-hydroxymethyldihydropteridine diphosphokinase [Cytophagaceae bacterium]